MKASRAMAYAIKRVSIAWRQRSQRRTCCLLARMRPVWRKPAAAIYVDSTGVPVPRPARGDFARGIDGSIDYMRACHAWSDRLTAMACEAFAVQFGKSLRGKAVAK